MKIISVFEPMGKKKMYFSPDHYLNRGSSFQLRPREKALLVFNSKSKCAKASDHFKIKFSKRHYYFKCPAYQFLIMIKNVSSKKKLICNTGCFLSRLLQHNLIQHCFTNMARKDLLQARRFSL